MDMYTAFAKVYDEFMDDIPYDMAAKYLQRLLKDLGIRDGIVLELGCGTGTLTRLMSDAGYDMIGLDASEDMLGKALAYEENAEETDRQILYLCQDMREFELYGTVAAVYALTDTMNYITEDEDFIEVLRLVNNYLDPEGYFIFDLKTEHFFRDILGDNTFAEHRDDATLLWENVYDEESRINEYAITIFQKEMIDQEEFYRKQEEFHYQKSYTLEKLQGFAKRAGMRFVASYEAYSKKEAKESVNDRIFVIMQEQGKKEV